MRFLESATVSRLRELTDALADDTGAELIALIDGTGYLITQSGIKAGERGEEVGVLAAAVSASTSALASSLGAGEPQEILQKCGTSFFPSHHPHAPVPASRCLPGTRILPE